MTKPFFCGRLIVPCLSAMTLLSGLLTGCSGKPDSAQSTGKTAVVAVSVSTIRAQKRDFPVQIQATGTVTPMTIVDVHSQLTSVISKVHFHEGQFVKAGDLLFTLDARTEEANVTKALAQLARDNAALADAKRLLERSKQLLLQNFISQSALDTAQSQVDGTGAAVLADQAAVQAAKVALSYARITAPQAGRVGAVTVFAGSTVQANVSSLVTITQIDPIAVSFNLPQRNLADALSALQGAGKQVTANLPDGGGSFSGQLQFVDSAVDLNSGTVKVKTVFKNPQGKLWPGAFVNVTLQSQTLKDAVVVPQAAVIQGARGTLVYTVVDGKATVRPVLVQAAQGLDAAVTGLLAGELVVLDGRQNLRPGVAVQERVTPPTNKASDAVPAQGTQKSKGQSAPTAKTGAM